MASMAGLKSSAEPAQAALQRVGLVVCEVGQFILGAHIPNVARVVHMPQLVEFPRPRPGVVALARVEAGLVPVIDVSHALGGGPTQGAKFLVLVEDKDASFGFPANAIESVLQIRADRIYFPRVGEVSVNHELLRGYWKFSARRNGYIVSCHRLHERLIGEPRKTPLPDLEKKA